MTPLSWWICSWLTRAPVRETSLRSPDRSLPHRSVPAIEVEVASAANTHSSKTAFRRSLPLIATPPRNSTTTARFPL